MIDEYGDKASVEIINNALWIDTHGQNVKFSKSMSRQLLDRLIDFVGNDVERLMKSVCEYGETGKKFGLEEDASTLSAVSNDPRITKAKVRYRIGQQYEVTPKDLGVLLGKSGGSANAAINASEAKRMCEEAGVPGFTRTVRWGTKSAPMVEGEVFPGVFIKRLEGAWSATAFGLTVPMQTAQDALDALRTRIETVL